MEDIRKEEYDLLVKAQELKDQNLISLVAVLFSRVIAKSEEITLELKTNAITIFLFEQMEALERLLLNFYYTDASNEFYVSLIGYRFHEGSHTWAFVKRFKKTRTKKKWTVLLDTSESIILLKNINDPALELITHTELEILLKNLPRTQLNYEDLADHFAIEFQSTQEFHKLNFISIYPIGSFLVTPTPNNTCYDFTCVAAGDYCIDTRQDQIRKILPPNFLIHGNWIKMKTLTQSLANDRISITLDLEKRKDPDKNPDFFQLKKKEVIFENFHVNIGGGPYNWHSFVPLLPSSPGQLSQSHELFSKAVHYKDDRSKFKAAPFEAFDGSWSRLAEKSLEIAYGLLSIPAEKPPPKLPTPKGKVSTEEDLDILKVEKESLEEEVIKLKKEIEEKGNLLQQYKDGMVTDEMFAKIIHTKKDLPFLDTKYYTQEAEMTDSADLIKALAYKVYHKTKSPVKKETLKTHALNLLSILSDYGIFTMATEISHLIPPEAVVYYLRTQKAPALTPEQVTLLHDSETVQELVATLFPEKVEVITSDLPVSVAYQILELVKTNIVLFNKIKGLLVKYVKGLDHKPGAIANKYSAILVTATQCDFVPQYYIGTGFTDLNRLLTQKYPLPTNQDDLNEKGTTPLALTVYFSQTSHEEGKLLKGSGFHATHNFPVKKEKVNNAIVRYYHNILEKKKEANLEIYEPLLLKTTDFLDSYLSLWINNEFHGFPLKVDPSLLVENELILIQPFTSTLKEKPFSGDIYIKCTKEKTDTWRLQSYLCTTVYSTN